MGKLILIALAVLAVLIIAGGGVLMLWNVPAPSARIEHPISYAQLPH
jgi:flagellar basal body-associated protein FliL